MCYHSYRLNNKDIKMLSYGITDIQTKPSLIKQIDMGKIIDKRTHKTLGYFISSKYDKLINPIIGYR